jgi:hypothetical protein
VFNRVEFESWKFHRSDSWADHDDSASVECKLKRFTVFEASEHLHVIYLEHHLRGKGLLTRIKEMKTPNVAEIFLQRFFFRLLMVDL